MNLQEEISRIKGMMGVGDPQKELIKHINNKLNDFKNKIPKEGNKFISVYEIIEEFRIYMISRVPDILKKMETGVGGDKFAMECYQKLLEITQSKLTDISPIKRMALKVIAPTKENYLKKVDECKDSCFDIFFEEFIDLTDFAIMVGWIDYYSRNDKLIENIFNFSKQSSNWVWKNKYSIIKNIATKVSNFIYT
jgi:hypothetical protein